MSKPPVIEELRRRLELTPSEKTADKSGQPRYDKALGFAIGDAATLGWASRLGGWSITEAGVEALDMFPDSYELRTELKRRYGEIDQRRKQALQSLADTTPTEVADFLASGQVKLPTSYRVLNVDGTVPRT